MTFLSSSKLGSPSIKAKAKIATLAVLSVSALFSSSGAIANSCSKSDIDYYLQRGFTNDQVVQLCAGPAVTQNTSQSTTQNIAQSNAQVNTQSQAQKQQSQQNNQVREDQSYLSAAIDAENISMTSQNMTLYPRECIDYGPSTGKASADLIETICVNTKLNINFTGMKIGKATKGLLFVRDSSLNIKGNIQRELLGMNELRRQDKEAILEKLSTNPTEVFLRIRKGINPSSVGDRLKKYAK